MVERLAQTQSLLQSAFFLFIMLKKKIRNGYNDKYLTGSLENVEILSRGIKLVTKLMRLIISDQKNQRVFSFLPPPLQKTKIHLIMLG